MVFSIILPFCFKLSLNLGTLKKFQLLCVNLLPVVGVDCYCVSLADSDESPNDANLNAHYMWVCCVGVWREERSTHMHIKKIRGTWQQNPLKNVRKMNDFGTGSHFTNNINFHV